MKCLTKGEGVGFSSLAASALVTLAPESDSTLAWIRSLPYNAPLPWFLVLKIPMPSAPYMASKHWLTIDSGTDESCLCPLTIVARLIRRGEGILEHKHREEHLFDLTHEIEKKEQMEKRIEKFNAIQKKLSER